MKISCIGLNSNLLLTNEQAKLIEFLKVKLYEIGENISSISYFENSLENLRNCHIEDNNIIFFIGTNSSIYNHNIKNNLSKIFGDKLTNNSTCFSSLQKYCSDSNIVFSMQEEMECMLPSKSIPLILDNYYNNGFMYKFNNTYAIFLPSNEEFLKVNYYSYILPLIKDINTNSLEHVVLKCFGILERDIRAILEELFNDKSLEIQIIGDDLDNAIYIRYQNTIDKNYIQNIVSDVCNKLNKFIYSTEDISIYQLACDLLNLRGKTIALAETITYGNINKNLSTINCNVIQDGYIFNNYNSILKTINIDKNILDKFGHYSVNAVYELANSLLEKTKSQIAVFVLGDINTDICYMAIGDINGIHVYKNKINSQNDNLINNLSKTAIFYLIKKLKANDLLM